jgi:hypothetical protein
MDYDSGTSYGYDQIQTSPLLNDFDNPYMEVPRILRDQQYTASAVRNNDTIPAPANLGHYAQYSPIARKSRIPLDTSTIEAMGDMSNIDQNGMMMIFIFLLIIIAVINTITIKNLGKQIEHIQYAAIHRELKK